jgi:uncharacterized protein YcnI
MTARRIARGAGLSTLLAVGLVGLTILPAEAHVTVHADTNTVGATDAGIAFRVLNEQDAATTTKVDIELPTDHPLLGVLVRPMPGWTSTVKKQTLNPPVKTDDGEVTEAVSRITWTANSAASGIPVGGYDDFDITAGKLPDGVSAITFKAIQTYSNGESVAWIEQSVDGQAAPEHPAAVLTLGTAAGGATTSPSAGQSGTSAPPASDAAASTGSTSDTLARGLGAAGIVLALLVGVAAYRVGRKAGRVRPAAPPAE